MKLGAFEKGNIEKINKLEKHFKIKLPTDYRNFLLNHNGAIVEDGYFFVEELKQTIMMGRFFGVDLEKSCNSIIRVNDEFKEDIPEKSLLIADDPGGALILLIFDGENDGVWYYDHAYFFKQSTDDLNTYFICETFSEFMDILQKP